VKLELERADWEMIWEALQYEVASLECLKRSDPHGQHAPTGVEKHGGPNHFLQRAEELKRLADKIAQHLIDLGEKNP
jgi:hypothetical protein